MNKHRFSLALLVVLLIVAGASSTYADISNAAVLFLRIAPGSRAAGMGEAYVAIADDATATHWNPAGLGRAPLAATWVKQNIPSNHGPLRQVAALNTGGGSGFDAYDLWAVDKHGVLVRFNQKNWETGEVFHTKTDETVAGKVRSYFSVEDEERLAKMVRKVAEANSKATYAEVTALRERVLNNAPEDYDMRESMETWLDSLVASYDRLLIDWERYRDVRNDVREALEDSVFSQQELDRVNTGVERAINRFIPEDLTIPYSAGYTGELTSIASNGDILLIGSTDGLMQYNGTRWNRFQQADDGLPSEHVTTIGMIGKWFVVGTDSGLVEHNGLTLSRYNQTTKPPTGRVAAVAGTNSQDIYAVIDNDLYHYNGTVWTNNHSHTVTLDEDPTAIAKRFSIFGSEMEVDRFMEKYAALAGESDSAEVALEPGQTVQIPYVAHIPDSVRSMYVEAGDRVWIGTDYGVVMYSPEGWSLPGYDRVEIPEGEDLESVVRGSVPTYLEGALRETYVARLIALNEDYAANSTVVVYKNPTALAVNQVNQHNNTIYVATIGGLLAYQNGSWSRAEVAGLSTAQMTGITTADEEVWFIAEDRLATYNAGHTEFTLMHVNWLPELADDLYYDFFSFVKSTETWGTFGGNITFISYGTITRTGETGEQLGTFESFDLAVTLSYGRGLTDKLAGGISAKFIHSRLSDVGAGDEKGKGTSSGFAIDLGLLYKLTNKLDLGVAITNIGPKMAYIDAAQSDDLPRNLAVGLAYKLWETEYTHWLITAEANKILVGLNDGFQQELEETVFNGGVEFGYLGLFAVRAGYIYDQEGQVKTPTLGAGVSLPILGRFKADFAYIPSSESVALANTLRISVSIIP